MNAQQVVNQIVGWIQQAVGIALLLLIAGAVIRHLGVSLPLRLPAPNATELAYLCGAYWLWRGGR